MPHYRALALFAGCFLLPTASALGADTGRILSGDEALPVVQTESKGGGVRPSTSDDSPRRTKKEDLGPSEMIPPPTPLSKVLIVDQQRVHMLEAGWDQYETLILLPGFPEPAVACQKMMDALAERFHVMAVDPQGFGFSGGPNWVTYSPQGMAQYILRLMDYLEIDKAHLAGFDLSATAAMRFAYDYPERVHSLIVGAGPVYPERYTGLLEEVQVPITGDQMFTRLLPRLKGYLEDGMGDPERYDEELAEELYTFLDDKQTKKSLKEWINSTGTDLYKMKNWYRQMEMPVFIVWGAADPYFPVDQAEELAGEFPHGSYYVVPEAGHFLILEQPRKVAMALVQHVFAPPPPPPPFSGLSYAAYRGQTCSRYFVVNNNLEKPATFSCSFDGMWTNEAGVVVESPNVDIEIIIEEDEDLVVEPGESAEIPLTVSMVDRSLKVETIYLAQIVCQAQERRTEIELEPLPLRMIIPQLGEPMPEAFGAKPIDQPFEMEIGDPPVEELISIE